MRAALWLAAALAAAACGKGDKEATRSPAPVPPATAEGTTVPAPVPAAMPDAAPSPATAPADAAPAGKPKPGGKESVDTEVAALQEEAARYADLLAGEIVSGDGAPMGERDLGRSLDDQVKEIREGGHQVQIGGSGGRGTRGGGDVRVGTGKGPSIDGPSGPPSPPAAAQPAWRVEVAVKVDDDIDPAPLRAKIQSVYAHGIRRCVEQAAKDNPDVPARVAITFELTDKGRTRSVRVTGVTGKLADCIAAKAGTWVFPPQKDDDGAPLEPSLRVDLRLGR